MTTKTLKMALGATGLLLTAACSKSSFDILNTNAPTIEQLTGNPTKATLARAALGSAAVFETDVGGDIARWAIYGREGYNLNGNDPRLTGEDISGPQDPNGHSAGGWAGKYQALRTINTYLAAIDQAPDLTSAEKSASKGFANTLKAILLHQAIVRNGTLGIPVDVEVGLDQPPAPFLTEAHAYDRIVALLDDAQTDLQAAGSTAFPFPMPPGYEDFATPAKFLQVNRAYMAKVMIHRATFLNEGASAYQAALTALNQSFITTAGLPASFSLGAYYAYASASGETGNPITEATSSTRFFVHSSIETGAQHKLNGDLDDRFTSKTFTVTARTVSGLTSTLKPVMYNTNSPTGSSPNLDADIAIIRNEELILIRAEAEWFTGAKQAALDDINLVRENSGGLEATTLTTGSSDAAFTTELLYNRTYSLLWEQGTRWLDARRFGLLSTLPLDRAGDVTWEFQIVPGGECDARSLPAPCTPATQ